MRAFPGKLLTIIAILSVLLTGMPIEQAHAAGIVVNTATDEDSANASCSLREAIIAANTNAAYNGCSAGAGADTITFLANYTITLTLGSQLPTISSVVTIDGNGELNTIIEAGVCDASFPTEQCPAVRFRVLEISSTGNLTLQDLTIRHGRCDGLCATDATVGGGVFNDGGALTATDVALSSNYASNGGGLYNDGGNATLTNVTIFDNQAWAGAGMSNHATNSTLTDVTFEYNWAQGGCGGLCNDQGSAVVTNATFKDNFGNYVGALQNSSTNLTLTNATFFSNDSLQYTSAMENYFSTVSVSNATFAENESTPALGRAVYNSGSSTVTFTNVILWDDPSVPEVVNAGGAVFAVDHSVVRGGCPVGSTCTDVINSDPLLGPLADNGGSTQTMALLSGSPAINAGTNTGCPETDQRGVSRPEGGVCDIGGYEAEWLTISGNAGSALAAVQYGLSQTTADVNGDYTFEVPPGWALSVTPSKPGCTFTPAQRSYAPVTSDMPNENYKAVCEPVGYKIGGLVYAPGVVLSYDNGGPQTATSNNSGIYSFIVPEHWSGTVTPSLAGCAFVPPSRAYPDVITPMLSENYFPTCTIPWYGIGGTAGTPGAVLSYVDGTAKTVTSLFSSEYILFVPEHWAGTVTPSKPGCTFSPPSRSYIDVIAHLPVEMYTANCTGFVISGNAGVEGATLSYQNAGPQTATADANGEYFFVVPDSWSGTVTPSKDGCSFAPGQRVYNTVTSDKPVEDYGATCPPQLFSISGNAGIAGAELAFDQGGPQTAVADGNGDYEFFVPSGWSGTVTPSKTNYLFDPGSRSYSNVTTDQANQDYDAFLDTPSILHVYPPENSTACFKPLVGVDLQLNASVRTGAGNFDPTKVTLKLDGIAVTGSAAIAQTTTSPASKARILYRVPNNLASGAHQGSFTHPSPSGPFTYNWSFNAAGITCPLSSTPLTETGDPSLWTLLTPELLSAPVTASESAAISRGPQAPAPDALGAQSPAIAPTQVSQPMVVTHILSGGPLACLPWGLTCPRTIIFKE